MVSQRKCKLLANDLAVRLPGCHGNLRQYLLVEHFVNRARTPCTVRKPLEIPDFCWKFTTCVKIGEKQNRLEVV